MRIIIVFIGMIFSMLLCKNRVDVHLYGDAALLALVSIGAQIAITGDWIVQNIRKRDDNDHS